MMRVEWREREQRPGWDISYTTIGGRFGTDPIELLREDARVPAARAISQAMCAATPRSTAASSVVSVWASVVRKVVQRGTRPSIHHRDRVVFETSVPDESELLAAIVGPIGQHWELDQSITLHPRFEKPFWDLLGEGDTPLRRWITPQASFESLVGAADSANERWVDFLLYRPWSIVPGVIEIDGSGHDSTKPADQARDQHLNQAGIKVRRIPGKDCTDPDHRDVVDLRSRVNLAWLGTADPSLVAAVHGPAAIHRLAYAIAEAVERGFLPPGAESWHITLNDTTGVATRQPNIALDLVESIATAWDLNIVPACIFINGHLWQQGTDGRYGPSDTASLAEPHVEIALDPFTPAHAALPSAVARPTIIIRGCLLPVELSWTAPTSLERCNRTGTKRSLNALNRLLRDLYGYDEFREGQREAISRILSGGDALVLLPTGAGKTLIYQMAGLLRPGVTLVIAPLKALIDDQERRLRELGMDRTVGLHSGRNLSKSDKKQIQRSIGQGEAIVVLVAPERLQIEEFRQQIGEAASHHLVNLAVVDEAHCVSEWGHQFRTSYLRLGRNLRRLCADLDDQPPPLLALTATASPRVLRDMKVELGLDENDPGMTHRPSNFDRPNLRYRIFPADADQRTATVSDAFEWIAQQLGMAPTELAVPNGSDTTSGIVFVPHARSGLQLGIDTFSSVARKALGVDDDAIAQYSGQPPNDAISPGAWDTKKAQHADDFRNNTRPVMVSTNAFGMGIDKPNIRYTLHVMLPSSIEAFAQESGRAGRDQRDSFCALVAPSDVGRGIAKIEQNAPPPKFAKGDVDVQLGFLQQGFASPDSETTATGTVAAELLNAARPGSQVTIPRGATNKQAEMREKALFRLLLIGLVDDYTIEYGSNTFTVYLTHFDEGTLRTTTAEFVGRAASNNRAAMDRVAAVAGGSTLELVDGLVGALIETVYERVEPARRRALHEMLQLSELRDGGDAIRARINAYLTEGPVASLLDQAVRGEAGLVATMDALLDTPPDELEWTGAAARYLESYPDHPLLLAVRALGEAWRPDGSRDEFRRQITAFATALADFGLSPQENAELAGRVLDLLRTYFGGSRWEWAADVWDTLEHAGPRTDLRVAEDEVLDLAAGGRFHILEINRIIRRRTSRAAAVGARIVQHHTSNQVSQ